MQEEGIMTAEKAIFEFLCQDDNLSVAMEMSDYVKQFKSDMQMLFWTSFNNTMKVKLSSSDYSNRWKFDQFKTSHVNTRWEKSHFVPIDQAVQGSLQLKLLFGQAGGDAYPLFWGAIWNKDPGDFNSPSMTTLVSNLIRRKINIPDPSPIWIYYGMYKYRIMDPEFLIKMYTEQERIVQEVTDDVWDLFEELSPIMETINREATLHA